MALNSFIVCSSLNKKVLMPAYTAIRRLMIVSECVTEQSCSEFVQEWLCECCAFLLYLNSEGSLATLMIRVQRGKISRV